MARGDGGGPIGVTVGEGAQQRAVIGDHAGQARRVEAESPTYGTQQFLAAIDDPRRLRVARMLTDDRVETDVGGHHRGTVEPRGGLLQLGLLGRQTLQHLLASSARLPGASAVPRAG